MRLIDADKLAERVTNLEEVAMEQVLKYEPCDEYEKWKLWSTILNERTAFKFDVFDAPTVDVIPIRHGHWKTTPTSWIYCSECECEPPNETNVATTYCPWCGAKMDGVTK